MKRQEQQGFLGTQQGKDGSSEEGNCWHRRDTSEQEERSRGLWRYEYILLASFISDNLSSRLMYNCDLITLHLTKNAKKF